jgi:hypothetical protein
MNEFPIVEAAYGVAAASLGFHPNHGRALEAQETP